MPSAVLVTREFIALDPNSTCTVGRSTGGTTVITRGTKPDGSLGDIETLLEFTPDQSKICHFFDSKKWTPIEFGRSRSCVDSDRNGSLGVGVDDTKKGRSVDEKSGNGDTVVERDQDTAVDDGCGWVGGVVRNGAEVMHYAGDGIGEDSKVGERDGRGWSVGQDENESRNGSDGDGDKTPQASQPDEEDRSPYNIPEDEVMMAMFEVSRPIGS